MAFQSKVAHHGLIKLLVEDALHSYKVPLSCESFRNLTREGDVKTLLEEIGTSSGEEQETVTKEKKNARSSAPTTVKKEQHKEKGAEEKVDSPILSVRELRSKSRRDKVGAGHVSPATPPAPASKPKEKTTTAKQTKKTPVPTGKVKQAPTGSPKTASTGSPRTASTGSQAKTQSKEKKADILAREAAAVLAGLSTPPVQKGKRKRDTLPWPDSRDPRTVALLFEKQSSDATAPTAVRPVLFCTAV